MKRFIFLLIVFFFCIFLFQHCKKESRCLGVFEFSEEARNIIPYKGGEHLIFIDSLNDSIKYTVEEPEYSFINRQIPGSDDYYKVERCAILPLHISISFFFPYDTALQLGFFIHSYRIESHPEIIGYFDGEWIYENGKFNELHKWYWSRVFYFDSIMIVNKMFYSVYELAMNDPSGIYSVYYNFSQGFVGIKTTAGRRWFMQN